MPMLDVDRLSVRYGTKQIVESLSFSVSEGQWLMIAGPNGAGKSTALAAITQGAPYTGRVLFEGQDVKNMKPALRAQAIGVLAQNHFVGYGFTVEEVVRLGRFAYSGGLLGRSREDDAAHVERALTLTGLQDRRRQSVLTLSGGELQRTFLLTGSTAWMLPRGCADCTASGPSHNPLRSPFGIIQSRSWDGLCRPGFFSRKFF